MIFLTSQDDGPGPEGPAPAAAVPLPDAESGGAAAGEDTGNGDLGPSKAALVEADVAPALGLAGATTTADGAEAEPEVMDSAVAGAVAPLQDSMSVQPAEDVGEAAGNGVPAAHALLEPNLPDPHAFLGHVNGAEPASDEAEQAGILF